MRNETRINAENMNTLLRREEYEKKINQEKQNLIEQFEERKNINVEYATKRTKEILKEYENEKEEVERKTKEAIKNGGFYVEKEKEFLIVLRVKGINKISPKPKKILQLLRLKKPNHAVFVRNNKSMREMIKRCRTHVAFGYASIELVRELIYKRGTARVEGMRVNLTNENIEDEFKGEIKCIEELIFQIYFGTKLFKQANKFLWPFTLNPPKSGFGGRKALDVVQGGSTGFHADKIGDLIKRMI